MAKGGETTLIQPPFHSVDAGESSSGIITVIPTTKLL
jgi:hypothetical protein